MYRMTVVYGQPDDPAAFDEYYSTTHTALAARINGVRRFEAVHCEALDGSTPEAYLIAEVYFDSPVTAAEALASPEGRAASRDIPNFATGGATILFTEVAD